jgi:hypothetical protein
MADKLERLPRVIEPVKLPHRRPDIGLIVPELLPLLFLNRHTRISFSPLPCTS